MSGYGNFLGLAWLYWTPPSRLWLCLSTLGLGHGMYNPYRLDYRLYKPSRDDFGLWWLFLDESWTIWPSFFWVVIFLWPLELDCTFPLLQDCYRVHLWCFICKPCHVATTKVEVSSLLETEMSCWLLYMSNLNLQHSNPLSLSLSQFMTSIPFSRSFLHIVFPFTFETC